MVSGFLTNNLGLAGFLPWGWASGQGFISPQECTVFRMSCLAHLRGFYYPLLFSPVTLITSFCVQYELPGHGLSSSEALAGVKVTSGGDGPRKTLCFGTCHGRVRAELSARAPKEGPNA